MKEAPWRPARDVEPDRVAIERLRARHVAHAQMHVADAQAVGAPGYDAVGGHFAQDVVDVERIGGDLQFDCRSIPRSAGRS